MRSPRSRVEFACRVGAFAILGWLLGMSLMPSTTRGVLRADDASLASKLPAWTRAPSSVALHADLASAPPPWVVDWLGALRHSGHAITWSGSPPAAAMSVEPLADPRRGIELAVAAPRGTTVVLTDDIGVLDTLHVARVGATVAVPVAVGRIEARVGAQRIAAPTPDSARLRAVAVVGGAGWEGKFIASALEERGWPVIARFAVAPSVDVKDGTLSLDTSRIAAIVVVDTAIQSLGPAIEQFVRSGGGLVLAGPSGASPALAPLAPGVVGERVRPSVEPTDTISLGGTGFYPVSGVRRDAIVLDRRPLGIAMAARRVGAGRVLQIGYDDSWRWRMAGGPGSEAAHREWWSRVVGSVAYVPPAPPSAIEAATMSSGESAPLANLVGRVGMARAVAGSRATSSLVDPRLLITLMMICLLAEWTSRRLRGLK
ncbi:MAG TPA: hypothetical protein VHV78_09870 [Gemmatimonadaceae bacterium]|nr:hypothetical protein [Gemmatimonadaceae bacterium]